MSAGGKFQDKENYLRVAKLMGARETLMKPFSNEMLYAAVNRAAALPRT